MVAQRYAIVCCIVSVFVVYEALGFGEAFQVRTTSDQTTEELQKKLRELQARIESLEKLREKDIATAEEKLHDVKVLLGEMQKTFKNQQEQQREQRRVLDQHQRMLNTLTANMKKCCPPKKDSTDEDGRPFSAGWIAMDYTAAVANVSSAACDLSCRR